MANGIRTSDLRGFNKGRGSKFRVGSRVRQTPEEGRRTYRSKRFGNNDKMMTIARKPLMIKRFDVSNKISVIVMTSSLELKFCD